MSWAAFGQTRKDLYAAVRIATQTATATDADTLEVTEAATGLVVDGTTGEAAHQATDLATIEVTSAFRGRVTTRRAKEDRR